MKPNNTPALKCVLTFIMELVRPSTRVNTEPNYALWHNLKANTFLSIFDVRGHAQIENSNMIH